MGRGVVKLDRCGAETRKRCWVELVGEAGQGAGQLELVFWETGSQAGGPAPDPAPAAQFSLARSLDSVAEVGWLEVTVLEATGLESTKMQGDFVDI